MSEQSQIVLIKAWDEKITDEERGYIAARILNMTYGDEATIKAFIEELDSNIRKRLRKR